MLHGCTVGAGSLIGMCATVLNGAVVGKGCLFLNLSLFGHLHHSRINVLRRCIVGANALVPERMVIPDGSVVMGAPAKVVKTLPKEKQDALLGSAGHYVQNQRRFRSGLESVP